MGITNIHVLHEDDASHRAQEDEARQIKAIRDHHAGKHSYRYPNPDCPLCRTS